MVYILLEGLYYLTPLQNIVANESYFFLTVFHMNIPDRNTCVTGENETDQTGI